jgi:hypothetical protein
MHHVRLIAIPPTIKVALVVELGLQFRALFL